MKELRNKRAETENEGFVYLGFIGNTGEGGMYL